MAHSQRSELIKRAIFEDFYTSGDGLVRLARSTTRNPVGAVVGHMMANGYMAVTVPSIRVKVYVHQVI